MTGQKAVIYKFEVGDIVDNIRFARSRRGMMASQGYVHDSVYSNGIVVEVDQITNTAKVETIDSFDDFKTVSVAGRRKDSHVSICRKLKTAISIVSKIEYQ